MTPTSPSPIFRPLTDTVEVPGVVTSRGGETVGYSDQATSYEPLLQIVLRAVQQQPMTLLVAILGGWGFLWLATLAAMVGAVVGGVVGFFGGLGMFGGNPYTVATTGLLGIGVGICVGAGSGFAAIASPVFSNPLTLVSTVVGGGLASTVLFVGYWFLEPWQVERHMGARRLSKREARFVLPMLHRASMQMGLNGALPRVRVLDDRTGINACCSMRHIIINKSLIDGAIPAAAVEAICAHELGHWRQGHSAVARLIFCAAWPVSITMKMGMVLSQNGGKVGSLIAHMLFWPSYVIRLNIIEPMALSGGRDYESEADALAGAAGYAAALAEALDRLGDLEPAPQSKIDVIFATHPPTELRVEALTDIAAAQPRVR